MRCRNSGFRGICATVRRPATGWRWSLQLMVLVSSVCVCRSLSNRWENLLLAPERKVAICAIEKNGWTIMSPLMSLMNSVNLTHRLPSRTMCAYHNRNCPAAFGQEWRNTSRLKGIFDDPDWRTAVVLREPIERYISGYNSKCNHSIATDRGGPKTCEHLLRIAAPDVHLNSVAHRLTAPQIWARGIKDPHWAPQHTFCGGLTNKSLRRYTSVIPYRNGSAVVWPPCLLAACRWTMVFAHSSERCLGWTGSITVLPSQARTDPRRHLPSAALTFFTLRAWCVSCHANRGRSWPRRTGQTTSCRGCKRCRGILRSRAASDRLNDQSRVHALSTSLALCVPSVR